MLRFSVQFIPKSKQISTIWTRHKWHYVLFIAHIQKMWLSFVMRKCKRISRAFNGITAADNDNKNNIFRNDTLFSFSISFNKSKWWGSCINDSFCEFHASNKIIWIMPTNVPTSFGHTWAISVVYTCKLLEALYLNRHPICSESLKLTQITVFTFVFFFPFIACFNKKKFN